jgi:hypothetical protein
VSVLASDGGLLNLWQLLRLAKIPGRLFARRIFIISGWAGSRQRNCARI